MKTFAVAALAAGLVVAGAASASADEHGGGLPPHGHVFLIGAQIEWDGPEPVLLGVRNCVDLAAGQALNLSAHHQHIHFGQAGEALRTRTKNVVAPVAPFPEIPWEDCASLLEIFGLE